MKKPIFALILCLMIFISCTVLAGCSAPAETKIEETTAVFSPNSAKSVLLYDVDRDLDICAYEPDARVVPGSLTKMVTALVVLENCDPEETVTAGTYDLPAGSIHINLKNGEVLTVKDLLAAMVLYSANDAALALADHVAGSQEAFVARMNERVTQMGCGDTKFTDVHGLDLEKSYTTAHDLVRIVKEAVKNDAFRQLFETKFYQIPNSAPGNNREFYTRNYMMDQATIPGFYDERVTGGMQSYAREVGGNLICTVETEGNYIAVVLGAERVFADTGWHVKYYGNFEEMTDLLAQYLTD